MDPVTHFEITYDEKERAMEFYKTVFGWKMIDMPEMQYTVVHTTETDKKGMTKKTNVINGGMMQKTDSASSPVIVVKVKSLDDTVKKVEAKGGKVVMPKVEVGDMGYYARVTDTEGNVIGIWEDK